MAATNENEHDILLFEKYSYVTEPPSTSGYDFRKIIVYNTQTQQYIAKILDKLNCGNWRVLQSFVLSHYNVQFTPKGISINEYFSYDGRCCKWELSNKYHPEFISEIRKIADNGWEHLDM